MQQFRKVSNWSNHWTNQRMVSFNWWTNEKPRKETSGPALRYLRSSNDFVYRQLADLDIPAIADTLYFKTYGWLLKLVALELHITTQAKQRSNQLRLITLLFKRSGAVSETFTNSMVQEKIQSLLQCDPYQGWCNNTCFESLSGNDPFEW